MEPGWYDDPRNPAWARWYDGESWTEHTVVKAEHPGPPPPPGVATPSPRQAAAPQPVSEQPVQTTGENHARWNRGWLAAGLLLVALIAGVVAVLALTGDDEEEPPEREAEADLGDSDGESAKDEAEITRCFVEGTPGVDLMTARVRVTNSSEELSTFTVVVDFETPGGTVLDTGVAFLEDLEPGQTDEAETLPAAPAPPGGASAFNCDLQEVARRPAGE
jgi:hypothetical protein